MYCYYDPYVVYGVMEGTRSKLLDENWLDDKFCSDINPDLRIMASDVVRGIMGNAVYGFVVELDSATGQVQQQVTEEQKQCIQTLYEILSNHWDTVGKNMIHREDWGAMTSQEQQELQDKVNCMMPKMGYFLAVAGDYDTETEHETYIPNQINAEQEEEQEEEEDVEEEEEEEEARRRRRRIVV
eukprot:CAMPEP_0176487150 /NCGR_PEP_ID=MMETSP0200_2-20121128/5963_1 /TAXON_ID=947934 /ORGANISM="Chaetoceros sp., Strain GSL56" /LENGTH=183 /DNA_ID=CAMNT_0017883929 /DNA_START=89 /DNA_END=640 /DNA_ORIENTATION=-